MAGAPDPLAVLKARGNAAFKFRAFSGAKEGVWGAPGGGKGGGDARAR